MSHSHGAVKFADNSIKFFEYNGTVDTCMPILYDNSEELIKNWRRDDFWQECNDSNHKYEEVEVATTYGRGFYWKGRACKECKVLLHPLEPDYDTNQDGLPDWYPNKKEIDEFWK